MNKAEETKKLAQRIIEHCCNHPDNRLKNKDSIVNDIIPELNHFVKEHLKSRVNAISDEDKKDLISSIRSAPSRKDADAYADYWFKNKLLKQ